MSKNLGSLMEKRHALGPLGLWLGLLFAVFLLVFEGPKLWGAKKSVPEQVTNPSEILRYQGPTYEFKVFRDKDYEVEAVTISASAEVFDGTFTAVVKRVSDGGEFSCFLSEPVREGWHGKMTFVQLHGRGAMYSNVCLFSPNFSPLFIH